MKPLLKYLLTALVGAVGGILGMVVGVFLIAYLLPQTPLGFMVGLVLFICSPIIGAFWAMGAGEVIGRLLDRFD